MFAYGTDSQKLSLILELGDPEGDGPALILMLDHGACITIGGDSPLCLRYPNFAMLTHYRGVELKDYEARDPRAFDNFPNYWDRSQTIDGCASQ